MVLEYLACREAFLLASSHNCLDIIVEGDALIVIQAIACHIIPIAIKELIKDIHELSKSFRSISFNHVKRGGNQVAHSLAHKAIYDVFFFFIMSMLK